MVFAVTRELLACYESLASSSGAVESPEPEITGHLRRSDGCRVLREDRGAGLEGDGGPQSAEFLFEVLVAAQYVPGAVHDRSAVGHQARQHQSRPAAQVRGLHDGSREPSGATDQGPVSAEEVYAGVHPVELLGDLEPVLVDVLRDDARPRGPCENDYHL